MKIWTTSLCWALFLIHLSNGEVIFPNQVSAKEYSRPQLNYNTYNATKPLPSDLDEDDDDLKDVDAMYIVPGQLGPQQMKAMNSAELYCEPEVFHHLYLTAGDHTRPMTNRWKRGRIGEFASLHDVCLKPNGLPLTRKCLYNAATQAAEWEYIGNWTQVTCLRDTRQRIISDELNALHVELLNAESRNLRGGMPERVEFTKIVCDLLEQPDYKLLPADVHFTSQILKAISTQPSSDEVAISEDVLSICNKFMSSDPRVLRTSANLNATNSLLETFENYMDGLSESLVPQSRCGRPLIAVPMLGTKMSRVQKRKRKNVETVDFAYIGVQVQLSLNVSVFYVNPRCANISGIAIYEPYSASPKRQTLHRAAVGHLLYRFVYMNETANDLLQEHGLQVAGYVPLTLWQSIETYFRGSGKQAVVVLKVYSHDTLFVETRLVQKRKPHSKILSISIPGYKARFPEALPFILRNEHYGKPTNLATMLGTGCGYWNYDTWVSDHVQTQSTNLLQQPLILCSTMHLTQFTFLLGGSYREGDCSGDVLITPQHQRTLDIISLVGCSLSLLGLTGIWLTAALFPKWRAVASNKMLLNMCVAIMLQMVLFVFVNTDEISQTLVYEHHYNYCVVLGALMQYSILVLFMWMLIVAYLQFQRYVTVLGVERPQHYIIKAALVAWGLPLIPTLLMAFINPDSYIPTTFQLNTDSGICYPSGYGLMFGVVLPVALIVIANFIIFILVFYSISHSLNQTLQRSERKMLSKQVRLSVLLFFLLGLSWIFGLFAFMKAGILFSYLFCLTATMQGFVLFIYFVILDEQTRNAWRDIFCPSKHTETRKKATEMQSMTTTSSGLETMARH